MKIRPEALASWDGADETARRAILEHAGARARRAYQAEVGGGMTSELRAPRLEIVRARTSPSLVATVASSYWVYHYAQSGSDWSIQTIDVVDASYAGGAVTERALHAQAINLSESATDHHDDERAAREAIDHWLGGGAVAIARALEAARQRADADSRKRRDGWPSEVYRTPVVEVIRARTQWGRTVVATCSTVWISFRARAGADWTSQFVTLEQTTIEGDRLEVEQVAHTETQYADRDPHDDDAFTHGVIDRWLLSVAGT